MATLNEHIDVLAASLSDITDQSDRNFIYILSAIKCEQHIRLNDRKNTLKQTKHQTKSQFFFANKYTNKAAGTNHLVKDSSRKSGTIQERSLNSPPIFADGDIAIL